MSIKEFKNNIKGEIGERKIARLLDDRNDEKLEKFHNLGIPCGDGIQQIDFIYVTKQAVFVIESKNWAGLIKGNVSDYYWYSILPGKRNEHYSPIKQNDNHIKFLRKIIDVKVPIYSLIVFPDSSDISSIYVNDKHVKIVQYSYLNETIDLIINDVDYEMSNKKFESVCAAIKPYNEIDDETSKRHIERIKSKYGDTSDVNDEYRYDNYPIDNENIKGIVYIILFVIIFIIFTFALLARCSNSGYSTNYNRSYNANSANTNVKQKNVGWKETNGMWYYYSADGSMVKNGCVQDNGKIYYMGTNGAMVKDKLEQVGDSYFYFGHDGAMIANSYDPTGQYYFGADGRLINNNGPQSYSYSAIESRSNRFNIISHKYFNDTYTKDEEYYSDRCKVSIIIPIFEERTLEDTILNNSIKDAVYDIASDVEEEFYNDDYIYSFVLDQYTIIKANDDAISVKLTGKIDHIEKIAYIIEYDRQNQEYTFWNE